MTVNKRYPTFNLEQNREFCFVPLYYLTEKPQIGVLAYGQ